LWVAMAAAVFGSTALATATPQLEPEGAEEITSFIQMDIQADSRMSGSNITVRLEDGIAILSGDAATLAQAERATARAIASKGVRAVVNQIVIAPGETSDISSSVKSALGQQKMFGPEGVTVTATGSRVKLTGKVGVWDEKDLAREVVSEVPGVTAIENNLVVTDEGVRSDAQIAKQLGFIIQDDPLYEGLHLSVSVKDGTASLTGEVGSQGEFNRLVRRSYVTGVVDVDVTGLGIDGSLVMEGLGDKNQAEGEALANLKQALSMDSRVPSSTIDVTLKEGVVVLSGEVAGLTQRDAAEATSRAIPGVLRVSNELKVSSSYAKAGGRVDIKSVSPPLMRPSR
ncbi:MAG: BON domain-containing protein, partial [Verrucomicrobiaceae bacterium]